MDQDQIADLIAFYLATAPGVQTSDRKSDALIVLTMTDGTVYNIDITDMGKA